MTNLQTQYLGLQLKNPLIIGASSLTMNVDQIKKCAAAGAGAVVLKSLFEEQIRLETASNSQDDTGIWGVFENMEAEIGMRYGTREYLDILSRSSREVDIPIIASINCLDTERWGEFTGEVEAAGAAAIELNIAIIPDFNEDSAELEARYENIVRTARKATKLPIAVKIGPYFTALPRFLARLRRAGADAFVLFNRFYRPDINLETQSITSGPRFSSSAELNISLRWIALLAGRLDADLAAAGGVHSGDDAIKMLLAGAQGIQVVSVLYQDGLSQLGSILARLEDWMTANEFDSIDAFRGNLSQAKNPDTELFGRMQYIKGLVDIE